MLAGSAATTRAEGLADDNQATGGIDRYARLANGGGDLNSVSGALTLYPNASGFDS